ncbi:PAS domain-containing sensor histidine kinase [uncultured Psychrobacter sp.]|uniref:sensor histidine kinase n=1 Tax=uncultured Psychrobacter sp. TaxID=259303 RepID=UPI00345856A4
MTPVSNTMTTIVGSLHQADTLPASQLRRLGVIYNSYRLIISVFLLLMVYAAVKTDESLLLPSLLQQTALIFYLILSLILFGLFLVALRRPRRQLAFGLGIDVIILSLLLYTSGAPDLQLTMLYMVVVAASFMLLPSSQALIITLLAIIFVIYQQFFYAIANSMSLTNLGDALLMSASFLAVGFLSWSISQRLVYVEKFAARQAEEVERLNTINQEVISQMLNGVMVIDRQRIVLANHAAYQLLGIPDLEASATDSQEKLSSFIPQYQNLVGKDYPLIYFQQQLAEQHSQLLADCLSAATGRTSDFVYELPAAANASVVNRLRVQVTPLKDHSQLILLEDLRREQANVQQLKLASLGQLTASIAHEIRNPLAAISQASQLLIEDVVDDTQATDDPGSTNTNVTSTQQQTAVDMTGNHELYKIIFAQTKRVNRIIEDILKLSRQQKPNQQTIELSTWMPEFLHNYYSEHNVVLRSDSEPAVKFDTHHLEQILINLINNALRYSSHTQTHSYAEVEIYCVQNDVIIDVLDNGVGVGADDIQHLFNPFFTTDKAGTGLGLYLSQAFSEVNHARLLYVPEHEKTCFRLIIPVVSIETDVENE